MSARAIIHVSLWTAMIVTCACASRARAAPELALTWPSVPGCPTAASIERRVQEQLSRELLDVKRTLRASAAITRGERGYTLTLRTERGSERGERTFEAASCSEVSEAAALVLSLSLGAAEPELAEVAAAPAAPPPARVQVAIAAAALGESGFLPRIGAGAQLGAAIAFRRSRVELSGLWLASARSEPAADGARVEVGLWTARASYCHDLLGRPPLALFACVGGELGRASGRGLSLRESSDGHFLWSAAWLGLRLTAELVRQLALYLEPALALPFDRRRFVSSDANQQRSAVLHEPAALSARLAIGAQITF